MRTMLIVLMALCLVGSIAIAKPALEKPVPMYSANSRAAEVEPNNDYLTANILTAGDDMTGAINPGGDVDYFALAAGANTIFTFETHAGDVGDTKLYVFDVDGVTQLDYNDDGGDGYYSLITYTFADAGTYFVEVTGYSGTTQGTYILSTTEEEPPPPPPPALAGGETCNDAVDLQVAGLARFSVDLSTYADDYDGFTCFSWGTAGGDAVYKIYLTQGESFIATEEGSCDMALYVTADCMTEIVCSDNCCSGAIETVSFTAPADGWYYLIVDAYTSSGCEVIVTIENPVGNEDSTWGDLKSLYR